MNDERPIFIPDGEVLIPQEQAAGPWFPGVQHGGAIAALVARAVQAVPAAVPMVTTRLSIDMSRRVPMGPTMVSTEVVRDGLRLQAVECRYVVDGETVGRATAMRVQESGGVSTPIPVRPGDEPLARARKIPSGAATERCGCARRNRSSPARQMTLG